MKGFLLLLSATAVYAQQTVWGRCGGVNWAGPFTCVAGTVCQYYGAYYSQCIPSAQAATTSSSSTLVTSTSSTKSSTSVASSSAAPTTTTPTTVSTAASTTLTGASSTTATLQSGYYWIRAVESPNYHSYLQTSPTAVPGTAILASYQTAGQFNIISSQLVQLTPSGFLYANVQNPSNITAFNKLALTFNTTQNTFGSFAFSGDAVQWSAVGVDRPNLSAWLVCAEQSLFVNLGAYGYETPTGCVDETIHYYNGAVANL